MAFQIIQPEHQQILHKLVSQIASSKSHQMSVDLAKLIDRVHQDIPDKRRISTGRYSIVKALGSALYPLLVDHNQSPLDFAILVVEELEADAFVRAIGLKLMVSSVLEHQNLSSVKNYFMTAAADEDWILRECVSGLIRPLIKAYPEEIQAWYLKLVRSTDPNLRRFVSESLRPVVENRWFHNQPEYALDIIHHLFQEPDPYPRTSVGNNLSDWMRVNQESTWPIVVKLANNGDKNSYWIAYRACRNYVKKQPSKVMDLLKVNEYKYKNRIHKREDLPC